MDPGGDEAAPGHGAGTARIEGIDALTLSSSAAGGLEAAFAPSAGMVCCSLLHAGEQLLGTRDGLRAYLERHSTMGIPLLYPWANRLGALEAEVAGKRVRVDPESDRVKLDDNGLPIHGLLTAAPGWRVEEHAVGAGGARLRAGFAFDSSSGLLWQFPFPHRLELAAELRGAILRITTSVRPAGGPVPIAFGFHPYLQLPGVAREAWEISAPVRERLLLDQRQLPTGAREPAAVEAGPLGERRFDDGFTAVEGEPFVLAGGGRRLELTLERGYPFAQLYAPGGPLLAFEPMTAPTNALVSGGPGLRVLEPGASFEAAFALAVGTA